MVAVKGMEMPKSCWHCNFCYDNKGYYCAINNNFLAYSIVDIPSDERPSDCPLVEVVTCKDCRHCFIDEDGHGYHCEKSDTERIPTCADFYCVHGERRE
jgi:hypothetical protein